jgi:cholesterol transport system auxiliary component
MKVRRLGGTLAVAVGLGALAGCGSLFESSIPAPQAYVLRLPPPASRAEGTAAGSVRVQRPEAGPGLDSDRIALLRSDRRFDFYAASRWAAPAPDLMESVLVDQLRASGAFSAVFEDTSPYPPRYNLRCSLARFESDYSSNGAGGGAAPLIQVALDCTFGRHRDRTLLANFTARGSAPARDDRLGAVVAAFETATAQAVGQLEKEIAAALAAETPATTTQ